MAKDKLKNTCRPYYTVGLRLNNQERMSKEKPSNTKPKPEGTHESSHWKIKDESDADIPKYVKIIEWNV